MRPFNNLTPTYQAFRHIFTAIILTDQVPDDAKDAATMNVTIHNALKLDEANYLVLKQTETSPATIPKSHSLLKLGLADIYRDNG